MRRDSNSKRRLSVRRETLRSLSADQLRRVAGGSDYWLDTDGGGGSEPILVRTETCDDYNQTGRSATGSALCRGSGVG